MIESTLDLATTGTTAIKAQLDAAKLITRLAFDDRLGKLCVTALMAPLGISPKLPAQFEPMLAGARQGWNRLASRVLRVAIPSGWDVDAARWVEAAAERAITDPRIRKGTLPVVGFWWIGAGTLTLQGELSGLTWESDDGGVNMYPFLATADEWAKGFMKEGDTSLDGPLAVSALRIDFDEPLGEIKRRWASANPTIPIPRYVQFLMMASSALRSGDLVEHAIPIPRPARERLQREFPGCWISPSSHVMTRSGTSPVH